jgi:hypothetical protein
MQTAADEPQAPYKLLSKRTKIIAATCLGLCAVVIAISVGVTQGSSSSPDASGSVRGLGKNGKATADAAATEAPTAAPTGRCIVSSSFSALYQFRHYLGPPASSIFTFRRN